MGGQWPACRRAPLESLDPDPCLLCRQLRCGLGFRGVLLQFAKPQLELIEEGCAFRRLTELLVTKLGERVFELLDLERAQLRLVLSRQARSPLREQHGPQRCDVCGKRISGVGHAATESQSASVVNHERRCSHPAACGRHVRCGSRQSIPSSKYPSCAGVIVTV